MQSTFKRNLLAGFGISIFLLLVSSIASYTSIQNLLYSSREVNHTNKVIIELENVLTNLKDAETSQRGFLLTTEGEYLTNYGSHGRNAMAALQRVRSLTMDYPEQTASADSLKALVQKRLDYLETNIQKKRSSITISNLDLEPGRQIML